MEKTIPNLENHNPILVDRRLVSSRFCSYATKVIVPQTLEEHLAKCDFVRKRILLSAGLNPMPEIKETEYFVSNEHEYEGIRIFDVIAYVLPGLKLTGNLYLPLEACSEKQVPGILCPHGHWDNGRVHHAPNGGVSMRCFQFARLGFAVFSYDMIGYNDNNDFNHFWSNQLRRKCDLFGVSTFGLQTLNSLKALDFLCKRPEVDSERIGCTGASGGASQTWFLAAIDRRVKVVAPVCMLSSHFQGGCACEEGPLLRVTGLTSFDVVAAIAPRPLMLPAVTGDWTNLNPRYEIPKMKDVYKLYSAENLVEHFYYDDCHNYNKRTRQHIYSFFVRHLMGKEASEIILEEDIPPPSPKLLWHNGVKPAEATEETIANAIKQLTEAYNQNVLDEGDDIERFKAEQREVLRQLLDDGRGEIRDVVYRIFGPVDGWGVEGGKVRPYTLSRRGVGDNLQVIDITSDKYVNNGEITLIIAEGTYRDYFGDGKKSSVVSAAMTEGKKLRIAELLGSGSNAWQMKYAIRDNQGPEGYSNFSTTFEESYFSMRVHDVITNIVQLREQGFSKINIVAEGTAIPVALAAAALTEVPIAVDLTRVDEAVWDEELNYHPLIKRIGGLAGLLKLNFVKPSEI